MTKPFALPVPPRPPKEPRVIASLWIGQRLSFIEEIVMKSYLDAGHRFLLFGDERPAELMPGVEYFDYREVVEAPFAIGPGAYHNNGVFSDLFRLILIRDLGVTWVDMDAYCLRAFDFPADQPLFATELSDDQVGNGVLYLPPSSPTLHEAIPYFYMDNPIPPFLPPEDRQALMARRDRGERFGIERLKWAVSGPYLLSYLLIKNDEMRHALPRAAFYGGMRSRRRPFSRLGVPLARIETEGAYSVHFYGRTRRFVRDENGGLPPEGSYLRLLCARHGIDPNRAPVV